MVADTLSMRDLRQWLVWRLEERNGELTKVPYSQRTGQRADSTAPETWCGYEEALSACEDHGYEGIGFVFTPEDDLCGVDLDKCLDPETGEIEGWAREIIEELDSYTEISPSGKGETARDASRPTTAGGTSPSQASTWPAHRRP